MQDTVQFAEPALAVTAEDGETDRAQWAALEVLGAGADGR
jgi:hypothetical protein